MSDWAALSDAYGPATEVPALLDAAAEGEDVWDDLWSRLCHQGTVYPASPAALPALIALAEEQDSSDAVQLATEILGSTDGAAAAGTDGWRRTHPAEVARLHAAAVRRWESAAAAVEQVYALRALLFVEGAFDSWVLDRLASEEVEFECPSCRADAYVELPLGAGASDVIPSTSEALNGWTDRAHRLAAEARRDDPGAGLLRLFGAATCGGCGRQADLLDALP